MNRLDYLTACTFSLILSCCFAVSTDDASISIELLSLKNADLSRRIKAVESSQPSQGRDAWARRLRFALRCRKFFGILD